ncbi:acyltransferase family protein [Marinobacter apostichopi]|uniref:acyltransferase family protein n=1 Tax=Marinobacter apostichopi TaxID=3035454 RepID=UPI0025743400|nr:acyltransferase [Marinobacter sp. LA51]
MSPNSTPVLQALTSLRGIAAILVMCHHFMFVLMPDIGYLVPSKLFYKSYLWVDLFFILSGFVLAYVYQTTFSSGFTRRDYRVFMQTRFARIYPLHFFVLTLFVGFEGIQLLLAELELESMSNLAVPFTGDESSETIITNLLLLQTLHWTAYWNQPAWSISAEWIIYFTLPFAMRWLLPFAHTRPLTLAAFALLPLVAIEWHFGDLGLHYAGWPMLIRCFCEACLGLLAFRCYQLGLFQKITTANLITPVLILNLVFLTLPGPGVISVVGFTWLVLCAAHLSDRQNHFLNHRALTYLGTISYSIYLIHWLVMDVVRDCVAFFTGATVSETFQLPEQLAIMSILIVIVIGISHFTYHRVEAPMRHRLKPSCPTQDRT